MAEAAQLRWRRWREAKSLPSSSSTAKRSPSDGPKLRKQRQPHTPEAREKIAEAARKRRWGLDVRYRMSLSHKGKQLSPEARARIAEGQRRRRARERAERGGGAAAAPQHSTELAREAVVIELSRLRQKISSWMLEYEAAHGRKPSMVETADVNPEMYRAFVRYVSLRDTLRASSGDGGGVPAPQGRAPL